MPGEHGVAQSTAEIAFENQPAGQDKHADAWGEAYLPGPQATQAEYSNHDVLPGVQASQLLLPTAAEHDPGRHEMHTPSCTRHVRIS